MASNNCTLCQKELDRRMHASACLVCEQGHTAWVHQRCFDRAIDKAIRVRSTRSTSFENIARSATHNWKTQKCASPDCIKWLSEYTQEAASDPQAAAAALKEDQTKIVFKAKAEEEEDEEEEVASDRCTALKVDGSRCNFTIADLELELCRRCAEKSRKQTEITQQFQASEANSEITQQLPRESPDKKDARPKLKSKVPAAGLNSMLKSLAKPAPPPAAKDPAAAATTPRDGVAKPAPLPGQPGSSPGNPTAFGATTAPSGSLAASALVSVPTPRPSGPAPNGPSVVAPPLVRPPGGSFASMASEGMGPSQGPAHASGTGPFGAAPSLPSPHANASNSTVSNANGFAGSAVAPGAFAPSAAADGAQGVGEAIATDAQLVAAVKFFVGSVASSNGSRASPRDIARFLSGLPGGPGGAVTAIEVLRSRFHKLRNLLEAYPRLFVILDQGLQGGDEYEVFLAPPLPPLEPVALHARRPGPDAASAAGASGGASDLLAQLTPKLSCPLPDSVASVLEALGLERYAHIFTDHQFLPNDLFLATDDDFKDIGIPVGPRVKLRTWLKSQILAGA